jgi:hypothetical protein
MQLQVSQALNQRLAMENPHLQKEGHPPELAGKATRIRIRTKKNKEKSNV